MNDLATPNSDGHRQEPDVQLHLRLSIHEIAVKSRIESAPTSHEEGEHVPDLAWDENTYKEVISSHTRRSSTGVDWLRVSGTELAADHAHDLPRNQGENVADLMWDENTYKEVISSHMSSCSWDLLT